MEIGYTQLPGKPPMHVVMKAQRPNASDNVAITLLAPNFGFISIGTPRQPPSEEDHWIDWMGDLEVSHPVTCGKLFVTSASRPRRTELCRDLIIDSPGLAFLRFP
jgi:hypothetical protein